MFLIIKTIALSEFRALRRQHTFVLLLTIFLAMALFSTYIGWSTKNTILKVYDETVKTMAAIGLTEAPANPFLNTPALAILKNMIVYVFLIGSLLGCQAYFFEADQSQRLDFREDGRDSACVGSDHGRVVSDQRVFGQSGV
jgi:ABC-type transport system involved in multi-copper enzyme maturation permease subunit